MLHDKKPLTPFLKWAGGKRWLAASLAPLLDGSKRYHEPFLGSGAVFFFHQPESALLSDKNEELISCYHAIRDFPTEVAQALHDLQSRHNDTFYYEMREDAPPSLVGRAARFLYLNRTCWNGLYRVNRKGMFNVPRGTKNEIVLRTDNFPAISSALKGVDIQCRDFEEVIDAARQGDFVFADPPYTVAHNKNGFIKYNEDIFRWSDQVRLAAAAERAARRGVRVVITNADHDDVRALYGNVFTKHSLSRASVISGNARGRGKTTELFLTNIDGAIAEAGV